MADNVIIVTLNLENKDVDTPFNEIETRADKASDKINESLGKAVKNSLDESNKSLSKMSEGFVKIGAVISSVAPVVVFLEKRFGVMSNLATKILAKFGINFNELKQSIIELIEVVQDVIDGKGSFKSLEIVFGGVLASLNLLSPKMEFFLGVMRHFISVKAGLAKVIALSATIGTTAAFGIAKFGQAAAAAFSVISTKATEAGRIIRGVTAFMFKPTGIFGVVNLLGDLALAFAAVSNALEVFDNALAKTLVKITGFTAAVLGSISAILGIAISGAAILGTKLASTLISFFQKQAAAFNKSERGALVFAAAVNAINRSSNGAIGSLETLEQKVLDVADAFNVSDDSVRKSAQELVLVGNRLGLTRQQIEKVLVASVELAKINKKDVFQTTMNVVNALNGNAQAVAALGIKLNETAVAAFALKESNVKNFRALKDNEKVQFRYNKLLKQYADVAGVGLVAANSLADQSERLERNISNVNKALGAGARLIEDNNVLNLIYNAALNNINDSVFKLAGFLGALGSRILQVGSLVLGLSFKFFTIIKLISILNFLLAQQSFLNILAARIPVINKSFIELASSLVGTTVQFRSASDVAAFFGLLIKSTLNTAMIQFTGTTYAASGALGVFKGLLMTTTSAIKRLLIYLLPILIPLIKIAAAIGVLVGLFKLFKNAISTVDAQTGAVTESYNILMDSLTASTSIFSPVIKLFTNFRDILFEIGRKAFGRVVAGVAAVIGSIAALVRRNPFGVFSQDTIVKFAGLENRLNGFQNKLAAVGYDMNKFSENTRNIAGSVEGVGRAVKKTSTRTFASVSEIIASMSQLFKDSIVGLKETYQLAQEGFIFVIRELAVNLFPNLLSIKNDVAELMDGITLKFESTAEQMKQQSQQIATSIKNAFVKFVGGGIQNLIESLKKGENAFENFVKFVLGSMGDLAIQMGSVLIFTGLGVESLKTLSGASAVAAGAGLVALGAVLKAFSGDSSGTSSPSSSSGGFSGGFSGGNSGILDSSTPDDIERQTSQSINITVEGSLVQQEELGKFIADISSESNQKNGTVVLNPRFA